jgi:molybdopterin molybdotransferase
MKLSHTSSYVSVDKAFTKLREHVKVRASHETVKVLEAYKRTLAKDIISAVNVPKYNSSHMDGYAVRYVNIKNASKSNPAIVKICKFQSWLENVSEHILPDKQAYKISTGGYLPTGSDTVIPIEAVQEIQYNNNHKVEKAIKVLSPVQKGSFVHHAGADIKKGQRVLTKGNVLRAQDIGLLAGMHIFHVPIFRKPNVALIPTGDELTSEFKKNMNPGKVLDTHSHVISLLVEEFGGTPINLGVTRDKLSVLQNKIRSALAKADLILTLGGSSVGVHDLVEEAINSIGDPGILIHGVKLDRGRVTGLAALESKPIIILPGPIQGAVNAFIIFASPLLRLLGGQTEKARELIVWATLTDRWEARKKFPDFTKVVYVKLSKSRHNAGNSAFVSRFGNGPFGATPLFGETESMTILTRSNGYTIIPEDITRMNRGKKVEVHFMPALSYVDTQFLD